MLKRTRVSTTIDMRRVGEAVSFPGIDPRINESLAFALDEQKVDAQFGPFVDVVLLPSEMHVTCRVGAEYAGNGFGLYHGKIHKDDQLLVEFPNGDPAEGGVVVKRFWNGADLPPKLAGSNEGDTAWVIEDKMTFRLVTSGTGGKVYFQSDDTVTLTSPKVRLGDESATEQYVLGTTYRQNEFQMNTTLQASWTTVQTVLTAVGGLLSAAGSAQIVPIAGAVIAAPFVAAAGAQLTALGALISTLFTQPIGQFDTGPTAYLSTVTQGK